MGAAMSSVVLVGVSWFSVLSCEVKFRHLTDISSLAEILCRHLYTHKDNFCSRQNANVCTESNFCKLHKMKKEAISNAY